MKIRNACFGEDVYLAVPKILPHNEGGAKPTICGTLALILKRISSDARKSPNDSYDCKQYRSIFEQHVISMTLRIETWLNSLADQSVPSPSPLKRKASAEGHSDHPRRGKRLRPTLPLTLHPPSQYILKESINLNNMQSPRRRRSPRKVGVQEHTLQEAEEPKPERSRAIIRSHKGGSPFKTPVQPSPAPVQSALPDASAQSEGSASALSALFLRSRTQSPTKASSEGSRRAKIAKRTNLLHLTPAVKFLQFAELKDTSSLPEGVQQVLRDHIIPITRNRVPCIPSVFRERISSNLDTPMKSKTIGEYLFSSELPYFAQEDASMIWQTIQDILSMARKYGRRDCTEAHWISVVVTPMLHLVRRLQPYQRLNSRLEALDMSTVKVNPSELIAFDSEDYYCDLDKRIDFAMGLELEEEEEDHLCQATFKTPRAARSINQTDSFVRFTPIFLNGEVKLPYQSTDPLVQLGAWVAAEYTKRQWESYSFDMPTLAMEVEGDIWNLYLAYAKPDSRPASRKAYQIEFIGPFPAGSTRDIEGCFKILASLCACADWANTAYRSWVRREILSKHV